jgi:hypothetical protein
MPGVFMLSMDRQLGLLRQVNQLGTVGVDCVTKV